MIGVVSDAEMLERASHALGRLDLFRPVSRRLVSDLVVAVGLRRIGHGPADTITTKPAVLVVLEGELRFRAKRLVVVSLGPPPDVRALFVTASLPPGTYVAYDAVVGGVDWSDSTIEAGGPERLRVFLLDAADFDRLPKVIVNACDPAALDLMNCAL